MRIETSISHQIEDLPRASSINIDGDVVDVAITRGGYTVAEVSELIVALTEARFLASGGVPAAIKGREPRVFQKGDPEPADVTKVTDGAGDLWVKRSRSWGLAKSGGHAWVLWSDVLQYAPLTEVMES